MSVSTDPATGTVRRAHRWDRGPGRIGRSPVRKGRHGVGSSGSRTRTPAVAPIRSAVALPPRPGPAAPVGRCPDQAPAHRWPVPASAGRSSALAAVCRAEPGFPSTVSPAVRPADPRPALPVAVGFGHVPAGRLLALVGDGGDAVVAPAPSPPLRLLPGGVPRGEPVDVADPVTLTRRGQIALVAAAAVATLAVILAAWWSASGGASAPARPAPARVVVQDSDTLWSIAVRIAPDRDPRDEVSDLRRLNRLADTVLIPGQELRTR